MWLLVDSPSFLEMPPFFPRLGHKDGASAHRDLIQNHYSEQVLQLSVIPLPCVATRFGNLIKTLRTGTARTEFLIAAESNKRQQMGKKKTTRGALLTSNLPQLQNLIKRDPEGYKDEVGGHFVFGVTDVHATLQFLHQLNHFESIRRISQLQPGDEGHTKRFRELIGFLSQVARMCLLRCSRLTVHNRWRHVIPKSPASFLGRSHLCYSKITQF
jgi:hypothetical protein